MQNIQIIPAILSKSLQELEEKLILLKEAYKFLGLDKKMMIQIDVCNSNFFKNFDFSIIEKYNDTFDFEIDLMSINIDKINQRLNELRHSNFKRIIYHYEDLGEKFSNFEFENFSKGKKIGLALIPKTSTEEIKPYLNKINFVQFMGINEVGYQGSPFNSKVIEKIKKFRSQNSEIIISVDGGVNLKNAQSLIEAGANRLVFGSAIFGENNSAQQIAENIKKFKNIEVRPLN